MKAKKMAKSSAKPMKHTDAMMDKKLVKKMIKPSALKATKSKKI